MYCQSCIGEIIMDENELRERIELNEVIDEGIDAMQKKKVRDFKDVAVDIEKYLKNK